MANIDHYINQIRNAIFGEEVRESIIGGLQAASLEAGQAAINAHQAIDAADTAIEKTEENELALAVLQEGLNSKVDGAYKDDEGFLYLTSNGQVVVGPLGPFAGNGGGGSGGSAENNAVLSMTNTSGWLFGTIAEGQECSVSFTWSSLENYLPTGVGSLRITAGGSSVSTMSVEQGEVLVDLKPYLKPGTNAIRLTLTDVYGNQRYLSFTIKVVAVSITSTFDASTPFDGTIHYTYVPTGAVAKTVHFVLDGQEHGTQIVSSSGRQQTYLIPAQSHGSHTLEVYFSAEVEGMPVESNHLFYDLICLQAGQQSPIIAATFNRKTVSQYESIVIPYQVYLPSSLTTQVVLKEGDTVINTLTVDRTLQTWTYRVATAGDHTLSIVCKETVRTISFHATETIIDAHAETNDQMLYLSSYGRSNGEENPAKWSYQDIEAKFENFRFVSDGWQQDADGITVLRVSGDDRLTIPYKIFESDCRVTGKTIEIELATRDVRDYDAVILSCMSANRGIQLTGQQAILRSEQTQISMQYKEGEHLRLSFVVEKRNENRLLYVYINGVMSGAIQYPTDDDFQQPQPVGISIGSNDCTTDLYTIRIYDNNLSAQQLLGNWVADTQVGELMMDRYTTNDVFDEYGQIVIDKLPKTLPYIIWEAEFLPQYKGNKVTVKGSYTDPVYTSKSFTFINTTLDVQGTSSQYYARKNYKAKFKTFTTSQGDINKYALRDDSIPVNTFTFKADVASSEGANNVELVRLFNDSCPIQTPPMRENPKVRWGIDGFPIVSFFRDTVSGQTSFLGKYNFNLDKGTPESYGFEEGDESWEILNNTSDRVVFESVDFSGDGWQGDFEARYPDGNTNSDKLAAMCQWVQSTKGNPEKFKSELSQHFSVESSLFYWLFTEAFLMVDSRAKNAFPTYFASDGKWYWLPYDMDTALGINNEGQLVFDYALEDIDHLEGGVDVFNGQQSIFWNNLRDAFGQELQAMYKELRSTGVWSYSRVSQMFEDHQSKWPIAVVNEDSRFKYLDPLTTEGNGSYLSMLQGLKTSQRAWWLYNRFRYLDSKYNVADDLTDVVTIRGYAKANVTVVPYADMYCNVKYGSILTSVRGKQNQSYTLECPLSNVNDTEIYLYSCSQLASVGDLSGFKVGYADFSKAERLSDLKLGDGASTYSNPNLTSLNLGNNRLLRTLDLRNCNNFEQTIDLTGCQNIEEIYMDGTMIRGINLPVGGILKKIHLPETLTNLTIINQLAIEEITIPDYSNITTLRLENVSSVIDSKEILNQIPEGARIRLTGMKWEVSSVEEIEEIYARLDQFIGMDENGLNTEVAQVQGSIHIESILGSQVATFNLRYPYIEIDADHVTSIVRYYTYDGATLLYEETVVDGNDATYSGSPSRSSTAQYDFHFSGWARSTSGTAWSGAQKSVKSDRTLYAAYSTTVRKYTVYFYNGSQLLETVPNVPYGGSCSYSAGSTADLVDPNETGMPFKEWQPAPSGITGTTRCYAQYMPVMEVKEIEDDWDTIIAHVDDGTYRNIYKLGNYKPIDLGEHGVINMQMIAFEMDTKENGEKAPVSWLSKELLKISRRWNPTLTETSHTETRKSWIEDEENGGYKSNIYASKRGSASATFTLTPAISGELTISYKVGGEDNSDKLTVYVDGSSIAYQISGDIDWRHKVIDVTAGKDVVIKAQYSKDEYVNQYGDTAYVKWSGIDVSVVADIPEVTCTIIDEIQAGSGTVGGWKDSELRTYYQETLFPLIPENIRSRIVPVVKKQTCRVLKEDKPLEIDKTTQITTETVWPPSEVEMNHTKANGGLYRDCLGDSSKRKKIVSGYTWNGSWYLRSSLHVLSAQTVDTSGDIKTNNVQGNQYLALGFCF